MPSGVRLRMGMSEAGEERGTSAVGGIGGQGEVRGKGVVEPVQAGVAPSAA